MAKEKSTRQKKLSVLIAASEMVPFAKTGGLADVAGALPKALARLGHEVRVVMPRYHKVDPEKYQLRDTGIKFDIDIALFKHTAAVFESTIPGTDIKAYFIDNEEFFNREELYRTPYGEYWDNAERFMFFSRAIVEMLKLLEYKPDVINCNDWHTGLIPVYLKTTYAGDSYYKGISTVFSVHNIAYQGVFDRSKLSHAGLPDSLYNMEQMEFYGGVNFMKGGIVFADMVNTVSKRYRDEIETPEFGYGLDGVLRSRKEDVRGVLNGIDYSVWNPAIDKNLFFNYDIETLEKKDDEKKRLLEESGLKYVEGVPLLGVVSRLDDQKGIDILAAIVHEMMKMNLQLVVLGTGEERYHGLFNHLRRQYPEKIGVHLKFDNALAHNVYAGSDMFLMPSHFEPCGLGQLISLKYGTVPVVRETGGLADTVKQYNFKTKQGNGFIFRGYNPWDFYQVIRIALDTFKNRPVWRKIQQNGMREDFSWDHAAAGYVDMYKDAIDKYTAASSSNG